MTDIVGIRFKKTGRIYYFDPSGIDVDINDDVVVKTSHGLEMGKVVIAARQIMDSEISEPLKSVIRKATEEDIQRTKEMESKEEEALIECGKLIGEIDLPMKLISAEYNIDGSRLTFYFSAEDRVDFRKLVKELSGRFQARVELRQVGPRDEARLIGGFGRCGRQLCCASFLGEFEPISIKMAKEQGLPLNPLKISGTCGRLLCCLRYENEQYRSMKKKMPKRGQQVSTQEGLAKVVGLNPLKETVMVELESKTAVELPLSEVTIAEKAG